VEQEEKPYKHIRWYQIYNWLTEVKVKLEDPVGIYLVKAFQRFLEVKQMSLQRIGWEYINGVPGMNNLFTMLDVALDRASIPRHSKTAGWDYGAYWLDDRKYTAVIHYDQHLIITFEIVDKTEYDKSLLKDDKYELREGKERLWFRLPLEEIHFFSLDKDEQLEEITKFVKTAYSEAERMRI